MNPDKVVVHVVDRERRDVVLQFLRERISQSRHASNLHSHGKILPFNKARADMALIGISDLRLFLGPQAFGRGVAGLRGGFRHRNQGAHSGLASCVIAWAS